MFYGHTACKTILTTDLMLYEEAVTDLYARGHELHRVTGRMFDLAPMRMLLKALGNPEKAFRSVLIAGTNGKGSTAATLASIMSAAGHRTGLYTSPHLIRINERIRFDGVSISDPDFVLQYSRVRDIGRRLVEEDRLSSEPSFFEVVTAMAFCYFAENMVDLAVLEVGMGGRLDATNTTEPILSIVTDIGLDHQEFLGDTVAQIAKEKAGILRPRVPVVTLPQQPGVDNALRSEMMRTRARPVDASGTLSVIASSGREFDHFIQPRTRFQLRDGDRTIDVSSPLVGKHQYRNLALAITAAQELDRSGLTISAQSIARGVQKTSWPGRFQVLSAGEDRPTAVIDIAHNPAGAEALRTSLVEIFGTRPLIMVFGAMRDKAIGEMAEILFPIAEMVVLTTTARNPRAASPDELKEITCHIGTPTVCASPVDQAIKRAQELAQSYLDPVLIITGSIYIAGDVMAELGMQF